MGDHAPDHAAPVRKQLVLKSADKVVYAVNVHDGDGGSGISFAEFKASHLAVSEVAARTSAAVFVASSDTVPTYEDFIEQFRMKDEDVLARVHEAATSTVLFLVMKRKEDSRKWAPRSGMEFHRVMLRNRSGNMEC